ATAGHADAKPAERHAAAADRGRDQRPPEPPQLPGAMRSSRKAALEIFNNPILIGAITILVVAVAVYLSYIAENGLPFVATYNVKVDVPNGAELVKNADVRIGGARVGQVLKIAAEPRGTDPGYNRPFERLNIAYQTVLQP